MMLLGKEASSKDFFCCRRKENYNIGNDDRGKYTRGNFSFSHDKKQIVSMKGSWDGVRGAYTNRTEFTRPMEQQAGI